MLYLFTGTDREKARGEMNAAIERLSKKREVNVTRITDANALEDLMTALRGPGMFGAEEFVILDGVFANEEMASVLLGALPRISSSKESFFMYEEKPAADLRRKLEKYAKTRARVDRPAKAKDNTVFALAGALSRGDRKALWVGYQKALSRGERAEAIHGILFWGAKRMMLAASKEGFERDRAALLVAELSELPHQARRRGFELEYALERFILMQTTH